MRWGIELWDKFEDVSKYVHKGIDFCSRYELFLKKRCDIENLYAKELKKLIEQFEPEPEREDTPTYLKCYATMLSELRDVASQHELVAENIEGHIILKLSQIIRSLKDERKKCISEKERYQLEFQNSEKELIKSKERYERAFKSLEKARLEHQRLDNDETSTKIEVKNALYAAEKKQNILSQFAGEYASQLAKTNTMKSLYYQTQLPQVFDVMQSLDIKRIENFRGFIHDTVRLEQEVAPRIDKCLNQILISSDQVDSEKDTEKVIYVYKTGIQIPEDYQYMELQSENLTNKLNGSSGTNGSSTLNSKNTTLSSQLLANLTSASQMNSKRKDKFKTLSRFRKALNISGKTDSNEWTNLPPEQLKNKLAERINNTKCQIDKAEKSRGGAIKMHNTYLENQALGDSRQTQAEIENMNQTIKSLNSQLNSYVEAYNKIESELSNNFNRLANQNSNNHIYQSPSQHSINSSNNNSSVPGTPISHHSKTPNQNNNEHYAVSTINQTNSGQTYQSSIGYSGNHVESFDEDDDLDSYCYENPSSAAVKAQILKTQQQQYQTSNLQNHSGLVSKASIESDCNSFTKTKDIMYADSQYDQVDSVQYQTCEGQHTSSTEEFALIGTALVLFDYKKGDIASAMDIDVNESLSILERDSGDGWTLAQRLNGERGYVPTKYIEIAFY